MKHVIEFRSYGTGSSSQPRPNRISLPLVPGATITTARPETEPARGILTPDERVTPEDVVGIVRREWIRARRGVAA